MIEASQYIKDLVSNIDNSLFASYDSASGKSFICNTKWARVGKVITDSLNRKFKVIEIGYDSYIIADPVSGGAEVLEGTCYLINPFFITGTKKATNMEWNLADSNLENKLPLVWLLEVISETGYGRGSSIEKEIETKLFFLDETDPSQYYTKDHREQVVIPMQKLMLEFLKAVENDRMYKSVENYRYKTFSRFGVEQETGVIKNVLDANLSGVALELTLTRFKENCKC
jgi:hypothetical protein|tara:strand:+ start:30 stop:713 length:684 start_codon:yes stop_codon:yes gene_type:complete